MSNPVSLKIINDKLEAWWQSYVPEVKVIKIESPAVVGKRLQIPVNGVWVFDPRSVKILDSSFGEIQGLGEVVKVYAADNSTLISEFVANSDPQPAVDENGGGTVNNPGSTEFTNTPYVEVSGAFPDPAPYPPARPPYYVIVGKQIARKDVPKSQALRLSRLMAQASAALKDVIQDLKGTSTWDLAMGPDLVNPKNPNDYFTLAGIGVRCDLLERFFGLETDGTDSTTRYADNPRPSQWPIQDPPADQKVPGHHSRHDAGKLTNWPAGTGQQHFESIPGGVLHAVGTYGADPFVHAGQHQFTEEGAPADPLFLHRLVGHLVDAWAHGALRDSLGGLSGDALSALHHLAEPSVDGAGGVAGFVDPTYLEKFVAVSSGNVKEFAFNVKRQSSGLTAPTTDPEDGGYAFVLLDTGTATGALLKVRNDSGTMECELRVVKETTPDAGFLKVTAWSVTQFTSSGTVAFGKSLSGGGKDAETARIQMKTGPGSDTYTLILEQGKSGSHTSNAISRIYMNPQGHLCVVRNAKWDSTSGNWLLDDTSSLADMLEVGGGVYVRRSPGTSGSPSVEFTDLGWIETFGQTAGTPSATTYGHATLSAGDRLISTADQAATDRFLAFHAGPGVSSRTRIIRSWDPAAGVNSDELSFYVMPGTSGGRIEIVSGARWKDALETGGDNQWHRNKNSGVTKLIIDGQGGLQEISVQFKGTGTSSFSDSQWDKSFQLCANYNSRGDGAMVSGAYTLKGKFSLNGYAGGAQGEVHGAETFKCSTAIAPSSVSVSSEASANIYGGLGIAIDAIDTLGFTFHTASAAAGVVWAVGTYTASS